MGPSENPEDVKKAYKEIMAILKNKYGIQKYDTLKSYKKDRIINNKSLKEAIRILFQYDSWENF